MTTVTSLFFRRWPMILFALVALPALSGCLAAAVGAGATTGMLIAQERGVGDAVTDAGIKVEVNHYLFQAHVDELFRAVSIDVVEGRVLLTGNVKTDELRDQATRLAYQARGVRDVINEIEVTDRGGVFNYSNDAWITGQLRAKVVLDDQINSVNYKITTQNGVVYLLGIARSAEELDRFVAHARNIPRVQRVVSHVLLRDDPRRAHAS